MAETKKFKVLVSDPVSEEGVRLIEDVAQVDIRTDLSPQELIDIIGEYDALLVRSSTKVTAEVITAGKKLKVIGRAGVGVDNIDVEKATEMGVLVVNAPEGNTISAAEHTMALMLAMARNISGASASMRENLWQRSKFLGVELYKKKLGIVGIGRIGGNVAKKARAFGMEILAYDPYISTEQIEKLGITPASPEEIYREADFITLHVPKTSQTLHMIGEREFAMMKDGVRIINCARGGLINEKDLYNAILNGKVAGAALDVFEEEPPKDNPLFSLEQVIATPHLGASTQEAQEKVAVQVADQIAHLFKGEPVHMAVNAPVLPPEIMAEVEHFIPLMETLGSFYMQVFNGKIDKIEVTYNGEIAAYPVTSLTTALLIGFLRIMLKSNVNFVNAPLLASQRGIKVKEITSTSADPFHNLITVNVTAGDDVYTIAGTLFEGDDIRIVRLGDYRIEVVPSRYMLVSRYKDRPGVIGKVGTILGEKNINIGNMQVGRQQSRGEALMVLQVDMPITEQILEEIKGIGYINSTCFVEL